MLDFFKNTQGAYFQIYSTWHFLQLILLISIVLLIYIYREPLKKFKNKNLFLVIGSFVLIINRFIDVFSKLVVGTFDFREHLPLHLCLITTIFFAIMVLCKKPKMFSFVYFFSLVGPLPALIFPQDTTFFDTYQFWEFVISHYLLVILNFYALFVCEYKLEKKDYLKAFILGNIIFFIMIIFNMIFDTNYIFSKDIPEVVINALPFIKLFYYPIFWLELTCVVVIHLALYPVHAVQRKNL